MIWNETREQASILTMWQPDAQKLWVTCWTVGIYFTDVKNVVEKHRYFTIFKVERFQSLPSSSSFLFSWKMSNIHIYRSRHFLLKISKLCGIFIIWDLDSFILLCVSSCRCAFSSGWEVQRAAWVHCWVFYQMDTQYESGLSFSQGLNVCVGLHIAYLETTQVP